MAVKYNDIIYQGFKFNGKEYCSYKFNGKYYNYCAACETYIDHNAFGNPGQDVYVTAQQTFDGGGKNVQTTFNLSLDCWKSATDIPFEHIFSKTDNTGSEPVTTYYQFETFWGSDIIYISIGDDLWNASDKQVPLTIEYLKVGEVANGTIIEATGYRTADGVQLVLKGSGSDDNYWDWVGLGFVIKP